MKKKLFIKKGSTATTSDGFNNDMYPYFFRYDSPDTWGYTVIMTKEGFMKLEAILELSCDIEYSEV